jgi:hypothetical protein
VSSSTLPPKDKSDSRDIHTRYIVLCYVIFTTCAEQARRAMAKSVKECIVPMKEEINKHKKY